MSVICAKIYEDKIVIAGDSIMVRGDSKYFNGDCPKLQRINDVIIGSTGYCQEGSLMRHYIREHKPKDSTVKSILDYIVEFKKWRKDYDEKKEVENSYILAFDGKCFSISGMFVYEISDYCVFGAGEDYASAALFLGHSPREAVKAAAALCCKVAEPIVEEVMPRL